MATNTITIEVSVYSHGNGTFDHRFVIDNKDYCFTKTAISSNVAPIESTDKITYCGVTCEPTVALVLPPGIHIAKLYKEVVFLPYSKPRVINNQNNVTHYLRDKIHRDGDLPAVEWADGDADYYKNGLRHREDDLPAVVRKIEQNEWFIDGKLHRDNDKPAVLYKSGAMAYYKHGVKYTPVFPQTEEIMTTLPENATNITAVVNGNHVTIKYGKK